MCPKDEKFIGTVAQLFSTHPGAESKNKVQSDASTLGLLIIPVVSHCSEELSIIDGR